MAFINAEGVNGLYNYVITQINPISILKAAFCTGVCFGGMIGILLGLAEGDAIGLLGGLFLGFICGLCFGLSGLICAAIFNALVPRIGGIRLTLESAPVPAGTSPPEQPEQGIIPAE